jgi:ubiquinol-cytochrome c reductase cytochrome b subunit
VIAGFLHIAFLHQTGSFTRNSDTSNGFLKGYSLITLYPFFLIKDAVLLFLVVLVFSLFIIFNPRIFDNPVNMIFADRMLTPRHVVPEWYFLYMYSILKLISHKNMGVILLLVVAIAPFFVVPTSASYNQWYDYKF